MNQTNSNTCTIGIDYALAAPNVLSVRWDGQAPKTPFSIPSNRGAMRKAIDEILDSAAAGAHVRVAFESSGRQLHRLLETIDGLTLFPVNPAASAFARKALNIAGAKSDEIDAASLREFLERNIESLKPATALDKASAQLAVLCEDRRAFVEQRKAEGNRMIEAVRYDFPALAAAFGTYSKLFAKLLAAFPELEALARKRTTTMDKWLRKNGRLGTKKRDAVLNALAAIDPGADGLRWRKASLHAASALLLETHIAAYDKDIAKRYAVHPLHDLVDSLPGTGAALGPRLCAFLGADPTRFPQAMDMLLRSGIAPVRRQSGNSFTVHRRLACRKFDLQTFTEFARCSTSSCAWAKAYTAAKRKAGKSAHTAYRALAYKWIRIIDACIRKGTTYQESKIKSPYNQPDKTDQQPDKYLEASCEKLSLKS